MMTRQLAATAEWAQRADSDRTAFECIVNIMRGRSFYSESYKQNNYIFYNNMNVVGKCICRGIKL